MSTAYTLSASETGIVPPSARNATIRATSSLARPLWVTNSLEKLLISMPVIGLRAKTSVRTAHPPPHVRLRSDIEERVRARLHRVPAGVVDDHDAANAVGRDAGGHLKRRRVEPEEPVPRPLRPAAESVVDEHHANRRTRLSQLV